MGGSFTPSKISNAINTTVSSGLHGAVEGLGSVTNSAYQDLTHHPLQGLEDIALAPASIPLAEAGGAATSVGNKLLPTKAPSGAGADTSSPAAAPTPDPVASSAAGGNSTTANTQQGKTPPLVSGSDVAASNPAYTAPTANPSTEALAGYDQNRGRASTLLTGPSGTEDAPTTTRKKLTAV